MSKTTIVVLCVSAVLVGCLAHYSQALRTGDYYDLDVAASDKHEHWEKGGESDHHESDFAKHGKKGEKGYESKHG